VGAFDYRTQGALTTKISENYHRRRCHQYGGHEGQRCCAIAPHIVVKQLIVQTYPDTFKRFKKGIDNTHVLST